MCCRQNQLPHAMNACKQVAFLLNCLPAPSQPSLCTRTWLRKRLKKIHFETSNGISCSLFYQNPFTKAACLIRVTLLSWRSRKPLPLHISKSQGNCCKLQYNSKLMNYGVCPHQVFLCPWINLIGFITAVRLVFLLNDSMRKNLNYTYVYKANISC